MFCILSYATCHSDQSPYIQHFFPATWEAIDKDCHGNAKRRLGDYSTRENPRFGQTHEPVVNRDLFTFTICHKWMKTLHHKVRILIHEMIGLEDWKETKVWKLDVKKAKAKVQETLAPGRVDGGSREQNIGKIGSDKSFVSHILYAAGLFLN